MPEPVRLGPTELKSRYGLSQRLITRIGALARRRIGLSPVLMESALPGSPLERLLLSGRLASSGEDLAADRLNASYRELGGEDLLVVAPWEDWQVLAIEEELEADEGWEETGTELVRIGYDPRALSSLLPHLEDASGLFSPEEIKRLKLQAVTGADPSERVTAIRQLALSPAPAREKIAVFLSLLSDAEARIRSEAASALQSLGLSSDVAGAITGLAEGREAQRLLAARRLIPLIRNGGELEVFVIVRSLLRSLDREESLEVRSAVLSAFAAAAPRMEHASADQPALLRLLMQQLREFPRPLRVPVERVLSAMARHDPEFVVRQLWELVRNESEVGTRIHVLCFLSQRELPEEVRAEVIQEMAAQLASLPTNDESALRLGNLVAAHGAVACRSLLDVFDRAHHLQRTHFVELLDRVATSREPAASADLKDDVARLFLRLLKGAELNVRLAVLEGGLCGDPDLSQEIRARLIEELFANLHDYHNPRTQGLVESTVSRMGLRAVEPLIGIINRASRREERIAALPVLGRTFAELEEGEAPVEELANAAIDLCERLAESAPVEVAAAALDALGDICSCPRVPPDTLLRVSRALRSGLGTERRGSTRRAFDALQALGKICGNSATPIDERLDTTNLFLQLFRSELPEVSSQVLEEDLERIFKLGREILAYTDMVPTLLQGFQDICLSPEIPDSLRDRILDALVTKWRAVTDFKEIWGPGNASLLLGTLKQVALSEVTSEPNQSKVFRTLATDYERPSILAVLGEICFHRRESPALGSLVPDLLEKALAYWVDQDRIERTDEPVLLRAFARLVSIPQPDESPEAGPRLRSRVLSLLYDALRHKVKDVDRALRELAENPSVPQPVREEIQDRLRNVFALAKGGLVD